MDRMNERMFRIMYYLKFSKWSPNLEVSPNKRLRHTDPLTLFFFFIVGRPD